MAKALDIRVPATAANLGPGFDSFGLALALYNRFRFTPADHNAITLAPGTCISTTGMDLTPEKNLVYQAFHYYFKHHQHPTPTVHIEIEGHIPLARGLGSSSSAIAAGLFAANSWHANACAMDNLIALATDIEGHPDNVAPAFTGGCQLCDESNDELPAQSNTPVQTYALPWPDDWQVIMVIPSYPLLTQTARNVMPTQVTMSDAVFNLRKASLLTYALLQQDKTAFAAALDDRLHQPYRQTLIPEFEAVATIAKNQGALGTVISGAGPTIAIFVTEAQKASILSTLKAEAPLFSTGDEPCKVLALAVDTQGTHHSHP